MNPNPVIIEIVLQQAQINVGNLPDGAKVLRFTAPNGIAVIVPMDAESVRQLSAALSGIAIASADFIKPAKH